jgi:hypothetical protein
LCGELLQLHKDIPDFPLVADGLFKPLKLFGEGKNLAGFHASGSE